MVRMISIILGVVAVAVLTALVSDSRSEEILEEKLSTRAETPSPVETKPNCGHPKQEKAAGEIINTFDRLTHGDYFIHTRYRMAKLEAPPEYGPPSKPVKVSYVAIKRSGKTVAKFDGDIYFPLGNRTEAGFFSLLNDGSKQLIVSQDIFKTGVQWVADFSKGLRIIFDGRKFLVGRESDDMTILDFEGDGISEIMVPITAFYGFEKWRLSTGDTPLPFIIFRYEPGQREYLPANPLFKACLLTDIEQAERNMRSMNDQPTLGRIMSVTLDYVFVGEDQRGWKFFDEVCKLPDKARIKEDMLKELNRHPVYRYVYKNRANG